MTLDNKMPACKHSLKKRMLRGFKKSMRQRLKVESEEA